MWAENWTDGGGSGQVVFEWEQRGCRGSQGLVGRLGDAVGLAAGHLPPDVRGEVLAASSRRWDEGQSCA